MFTRGQLEWAIAQATNRTIGPGGPPRRDLQMKLKRLLDIDRQREVDTAQAWPEFRRFAFLSGVLPGKGVAIDYTAFDAFSLLLGLHLLESNVPQLAVIRLLRLIRLELEREHKRILRLSPERLADSKRGLESRIKEGLLVEDVRKMVFLILPTGAGAHLLYRHKQETIKLANIANANELVDVVAYLTRVMPPVLVFELINLAHQLAWWLNHAPLIRRGRT